MRIQHMIEAAFQIGMEKIDYSINCIKSKR